MRNWIDLVENAAPQWPEELEDNYAIADYIESVSPSYIDHELCAENFRDCRAELKYLPITAISDKNAAHHERIPERELEYARMNPETMPPLLIDNGVIEDGHHRFRVAKELGLTHLWCYVIVYEGDLADDEEENDELF